MGSSRSCSAYSPCGLPSMRILGSTRYIQILTQRRDGSMLSLFNAPCLPSTSLHQTAYAVLPCPTSPPMNRTLRESVIGGGRNIPLNHRRGLSLNGAPNSKDSPDENLDLFSKSRRSLSVASSDESDVSVKLGRLSIGSVKQGKSGFDDLLSSADGGKHDYDW
ncbi:hypothetical protein CDL12_12938 [Handroanthus impetiginosus]|uniref:Uncharacterized protein n=1 Tax=Handroanthus impetiginosus TaxID=429701 RepID=A0A2G9HA82_9LAMI|nr:hypothetical protein CDL12_12938 [Handroanthus impetiginosus]